MSVTRANVDFAKRIFSDRVGNDYVYGGNWNPNNTSVGTDCSGLVIDICDAVRNGTAMAWSRHGMSTESWRPIDVGQTGTIFGTVCVAHPRDFPSDAPVKIAIHHGPGGGANSHMWCEVEGIRMESNGSDGCVTGNQARSVYDTGYANDWHYLPGPVTGSGPDVGPVSVLARATGLPEARAAQILPQVVDGLSASECVTPLRVAMWLAQIGHESDGFNATEEYQDGDTSQDRWKYKGRTWIQITWRTNYAGFSRWCFDRALVDSPTHFVDDPTALAEQRWAGLGPAWYWTVARPQINGLCDGGDLYGVTRAINGGTNGLPDRNTRYVRARALGDALLALTKAAPPPDDWEELMALTVKSRSIYAPPGEPEIPVVDMIAALDAHGDHESYVEAQARLGEPDALRRVALTAAGKNQYGTAAFAVNQAAKVLSEIETANPDLLRDYLKG